MVYQVYRLCDLLALYDCILYNCVKLIENQAELQIVNS